MIHLKNLTVVALSLALIGCNGGGGSGATHITVRPKWNFEAYKRIAVLPMQVSDPRARHTAEIATNALTDMLTNNGQFSVLAHGELKEVLTEQDLSRLADVADPSTALPEGKIQSAQALVIGKITEFKLVAEKLQGRRPIFVRDRQGRFLRDRYGRRVVAREEVVDIYHHGAVVGGTVRVIDAATGRILLSHSVPPIALEDKQQGSPPRASPQEMASRAADEMAVDFYKRIAPVQTRVKLDSDMLFVALDYFDGEYETTKSVPTTHEQFLVVVRDLPHSCDRNSFRVTVTEQDGRKDLFAAEFVWSAGARAGVSFPIKMADLTATGGLRFVAKLYSVGDDQPLLTRKFKIEVPESQAAAAGGGATRRFASNDVLPTTLTVAGRIIAP